MSFRLSTVIGLFPYTAAMMALVGCVVGPDYDGPPNAAPIGMNAPAFRRASGAMAIATPPLANWWTALGDPVLNQIEDQALARSPTLAAAEARLKNARATLNKRESDLLPSGGANALYLRSLIPSALGAATAGSGSSGGGGSSNTATDLYTTFLDATWQIDLFGGTRRKIESAQATTEYRRAEIEDAQVTLTGDVARAYVNLRDRQNRLALAQRNTLAQRRRADLTAQRRAGGTASELDVERLITQLKQTESEVPTLAGEVEIYSDQLAQLSGQEPGALDTVLAAPRAIPLPPAQITVGDPATMIRHRPDIRAAERQIATENALIGANIAQYFPQVTLLGTIGYAGNRPGKLFAGNTLTYAGGPSISWNIFDAPQISAQVAEARASTEEARQNYRKTVLAALLDAENSLSRFGHERDDVEILTAANTSASHAAELSNQRVAGGTSNLIDMLDTERQRIQSESNLAKGQAQLTTDWVALQGSLGLGWGTTEVAAGR